MAKAKEKNKAPIYSMYCEICKKYSSCGPHKCSCEDFDPSINIKLSKNNKNS